MPRRHGGFVAKGQQEVGRGGTGDDGERGRNGRNEMMIVRFHFS